MKQSLVNIFGTVGKGIEIAASAVKDGFLAMTNAVGNGYNALANISPEPIKNDLTAARDGTKNAVASVALFVGEKAQGVSDGVAGTFIKIGYSFLTEPTKISEVQVVVLSPTSAKVTWKTNHPANGKVNYGFGSGDYKFEQQTNKRTTYHEFILNDLTPDTGYHYEVMSQNKNYVYDANREFKTPKE